MQNDNVKIIFKIKDSKDHIVVFNNDSKILILSNYIEDK